jgi:hypothetical protein
MDDSERRIREMVEERMGVRRKDTRPRWRRWVAVVGGWRAAAIILVLGAVFALGFTYADRAIHRAWYGERAR